LGAIVNIAARIVFLTVLLLGRAAFAQGPTGTDSVACFNAPTQTCLLREAFELLRSSASGDGHHSSLEKIVELHVNAGRIGEARRVAEAISSRSISRINALRMIASAQARAGALQDASHTFDQAHQLIDARRNPLAQTGALLAIARAEAAAALAAAAVRSLTEGLEVAVRIDLRSHACGFPNPEWSLAGLLKGLAEGLAKAGDVGSAIRAARAAGLQDVRAEGLRVVADVQSQNGATTEARALLLEAIDAAKASRRRQPSLYCANQFHGVDDLVYTNQVSRIAIAQAKTGFVDDAAATFAALLDAVDGIESAHTFSAELRRSEALSGIATALEEAGLTAQSAQTFDRAVKAVATVDGDRFSVSALVRLARAQHEAGRRGEAEATLVRALERARAATDEVRAGAIVNVLEARDDLELRADTREALSEALAAARFAKGPELLRRKIARLKLVAGARDDAVALFRGLLESAWAAEREQDKVNALFTAIRGWPVLHRGELVFRVEKELISSTAPQAVQLAQSIKNATLRANILTLVAEALPD
jgi:hypothetical protein